jgi:hypothetical protein
MAWLLGLGVMLGQVDLARAGGESPRKETVEFDADRGEWVEVAPAELGTADGDLQQARALQADRKLSAAQRAIRRWIKTYGEDAALYPYAALLDVENRIARRDYYDAHVKLQEFISRFGGTEFETVALNHQFVIAEVFLSGTRRKFLGMRMLKADDIGIAILDEIAVNHPGTRLGELATMTKANHYFETGDFVMAEYEYNQLTQNYGKSRYTRPALLQGARSALASFSGIRFDDAPLIESQERFRKYLTQYPGSAEQDGIGLILDDIQETRAAKELSIGRYYRRAGKPNAARFYFESTRDNWPDSSAAIEAAQELQALAGVEEEDAGSLPAAAPTDAESDPEREALDSLKPELNRDDPAVRE